jgi:Helix-turn-helix domain
MSVEFITPVLKNSRSTGLNKFVLVCLANYADEHGVSYPSVSTLANRCGISETSVHKCIKKLMALGEVELVEAGGMANQIKKANRYKIHVPQDPFVRQPRKKVILNDLETTGTQYAGVRDTQGCVECTPAQDVRVRSTVKTGARGVPIPVRAAHPIPSVDTSVNRHKEIAENAGDLTLTSETPKKDKRRTSCFEELERHVVRNLGLTTEDAYWLWDKWEGNGWKVDGKSMACWRSTASSWERTKRIFPSQNKEGKGNRFSGSKTGIVSTS